MIKYYRTFLGQGFDALTTERIRELVKIYVLRCHAIRKLHVTPPMHRLTDRRLMFSYDHDVL